MAHKWTKAQRMKLSRAMKTMHAKKQLTKRVEALPASFEAPIIEVLQQSGDEKLNQLAALIVAVWKKL